MISRPGLKLGQRYLSLHWPIDMQTPADQEDDPGF